jgi:cytochrome P450
MSTASVPAPLATSGRVRFPVTHGRLLDLARNPLACMRQLYQAHGLLAGLQEDGIRLVFAFGPAFNQILLSDPQTFHARFFMLEGPRKSSQRRLAHNLLSMNGDEHKRHRRMAIPPLKKEAVEGYHDALARLAMELVEEWQPGEVRDLYRELNRHMLRVTSSILFGFNQPELAYALGGRIEQWVGTLQELGMGAFVADEAISGAYPRLLKVAEELEAQVVAMLAHRRSLGQNGNDLLAILLRAHDDPAIGLTYDELIGQSSILFAAAYLTTSNTLAWTLFLIAQHPEVAADLADELDGVLRGDAPTLAQLEQLPLLDRVIKESMRVLPASFYSQRITTMPVELGGYPLPRGMPVVFSQFMTHHLPDLFPEPEAFRPERWQTIQPSPYAYLPFAAGPHMCIGATMAMMTIKMTLPAILQRFHPQVVPGSRIDGKVISTMLTPQGMPMLLAPRTQPFCLSPVEGNVHEMVTLN